MYCIVQCSGQWQSLETGYTGTVSSVHFISSDIGFYPGGNAIYKTIDGGRNWMRYVIEDGNTYELRSIHFPSPMVGYVVGETVYKTTNAGLSWDSLYTLSNRNEGDLSVVKFVRFADPVHGMIGLIGSPLYTQDGGSKWAMTGSTFESPTWNYDVSILDGGVAIIGGWNPNGAGDFGMIAKSTDNGETWVGISDNQLFFESMQIRSVFFHNAMRGWVAGSRISVGRPYSSMRVMFTTDGGETWDSPNMMFPATVNCIRFANELVGFIGDEDGMIYSTVDGGVTWIPENAETFGRAVKDICIVNGSVVYVTGESGFMLKRSIVANVDKKSEDQELSIFPNPSSGRVNFTSSVENGDPYDCLIEIMDSFGRVAYTNFKIAKLLTLDLSSLPKGMYFVRVRTGHNVQIIALSLI